MNKGNTLHLYPAGSAVAAVCKGALTALLNPQNFSVQIKLQGYLPFDADEVMVKEDGCICKYNKKLDDGTVLQFVANAQYCEEQGIILKSGAGVGVAMDESYLGKNHPAIQPQVVGLIFSELLKMLPKHFTAGIEIELSVENGLEIADKNPIMGIQNGIAIDDEKRNCMLYPMKTESILKEMVWGGNKLKKVFGKKIPNTKIGESWEVSCHKDGISRISNGEYKGMKLTDLITILKEDLTGQDGDEFSLFFKIIDANDKTSIQVHPDNAYAYEHEDGALGKTEMWYIIDAEPGAKIGYGFNKDMTADEVRVAIDEGNLEQFINYINVKAGEGYFVPAGLVHCLGKGILVAEIQQNSNITYRIYDYNRTDQGKKRELHIDKALAVANLKKTHISSRKTDGDLVECEYFTYEKIVLNGQNQDSSNGSYHFLFFAEGQGSIHCKAGEFLYRKGDTYIIPAALGEYCVKGDGVYIKLY